MKTEQETLKLRTALDVLNAWLVLARDRETSPAKREKQHQLSDAYAATGVNVWVTSYDGTQDFLVCGLAIYGGKLHVKAGPVYMTILHDDAQNPREAR